MRAPLLLTALLVTVGCSAPAPERETRGSTDSLIVGGTTADVKAFEGMIQTENDRTGPWCGATLIAADWAVSAAHCVQAALPGQGFQRVVLGRQLANGADGETINVDQVIPHAGYSATENSNDIVLLHLAQKSVHKPVRLATKAEWPTLSQAGTNVTVIGWGATSEGGEQSNTLLQTTVPIVGLNQCNQQYQGILTDKQVCAGLQQGGQDSCQGDSGGPLFAKVGGVNVQIGVVSFGNGCARANFAGVYTAVAQYRDWIETNTRGAVPATATTPTPTPAPAADAGVPTSESDGGAPAPDNAGGPGSEEDTGSAEPSPVGAKPNTTSDDEDESDDDYRPSQKKKKKSTSTPTADDDATAQRVAACSMGSPTSSGGNTAIVVAFVALALVLRRASQRKTLPSSR